MLYVYVNKRIVCGKAFNRWWGKMKNWINKYLFGKYLKFQQALLLLLLYFFIFIYVFFPIFILLRKYIFHFRRNGNKGNCDSCSEVFTDKHIHCRMNIYLWKFFYFSRNMKMKIENSIQGNKVKIFIGKWTLRMYLFVSVLDSEVPGNFYEEIGSWRYVYWMPTVLTLISNSAKWD